MKTKILTALRETGEYISGQELCERFGVSRTAIWKAVNQLKESGYTIEAIRNKGYRLISVPDYLSENELSSIRKTDWAGNTICYYPVLDSTNNKAKQLAEEGYEQGLLVVTDQQEAGRGRCGRNWTSPPGEGIFMSLLLKPQIVPKNASMLTLIAALSVSEAIIRCTDSRPDIKWPNDIVMNGRKICGILTEMSAQFEYINHIVIGIGINVHNKTFPDEISNTATSLFLETQKHFNRAAIIESVLERFEENYSIYLKSQDLSQLMEKYNEVLVSRNKKVRVLDPNRPFEGVARGITEKGELIVETVSGKKLVSSGEVSVRGVYGYV